eukprot:91805_1
MDVTRLKSFGKNLDGRVEIDMDTFRFSSGSEDDLDCGSRFIIQSAGLVTKTHTDAAAKVNSRNVSMDLTALENSDDIPTIDKICRTIREKIIPRNVCIICVRVRPI